MRCNKVDGIQLKDHVTAGQHHSRKDVLLETDLVLLSIENQVICMTFVKILSWIVCAQSDFVDSGLHNSL